MEKIIQDVIKTAIKLEEEAMGTYLIDAQARSGFSDKVFFDLLKTEIQGLKKEYNFFDISTFNILNHVDYLNQHLDRRDIFEFQKGCRSINIKVEALNNSLNQILLKKIQSSSKIKIKRESMDKKKRFINELKEKAKREEIKNCFPLQLTQVIEHFQLLIESTNSAGKVWMTMENFELFIRRSFGQELQLPKPEIHLGSDGKYAVVKLFYLFYFNCMEDDIMENRKKDRFVELLSNAFETTKFNDLRNDNFKGDKSRYEWL